MRNKNKIQLNAPAGSLPSLIAAVDAAFFAGKASVSGSIVKAFRVKNKFLSLLQKYLRASSALSKTGNFV